MENARAVVVTDLEHIMNQAGGEIAVMAGKRLLIVGGGGFLGFYLVQAVLEWNLRNEGRVRSLLENIDVTVFDNFIRGVPSWLTSLEGTKAFHVIRHDITQPLPIGMPDFHYVIHAGSIGSPIHYRRHPIETMDANVNGLRSLLDYARLQGAKGRPVEAFLFLSSARIYGDPTPDNVPTAETYLGSVSYTGPDACHDESKRYGETLCVNFADKHGIAVKVARPFNHYGPGLKITDGRLMPNLCRDIFAGRDISLLSDGSAKRAFCYVADAVAGYYQLLIKGRAGEAYNIGAEAPEISVADLADKLAGFARSILDYRGQVVRKPGANQESPVEHEARRVPVIRKAREHFGYDPSISLENGLRRTLIWYRDNLEGKEE